MIGTDLSRYVDFTGCTVMYGGVAIGEIDRLNEMKIDTENTFNNVLKTFPRCEGTFTLRKTSVEFKMLMRSVTHGKQDGKYKHYKRIVNRKKLTAKLKAKGKM